MLFQRCCSFSGKTSIRNTITIVTHVLVHEEVFYFIIPLLLLLQLQLLLLFVVSFIFIRRCRTFISVVYIELYSHTQICIYQWNYYLSGDTSYIPAFCLKLTILFLNYITYLIIFVLQQRMIQFVPFQRQQLLNLTLKSRIAHVEITNDIVILIRSIVVAQRALRIDDLLSLRFR